MVRKSEAPTKTLLKMIPEIGDTLKGLATVFADMWPKALMD